MTEKYKASKDNKIAEYVEEGFGNVLASVGSASNNYYLTTKEQEPEPGLYYFYARWYDPQVGRFLTKDLIGIKGGINLFQFVFNSPVNYCDCAGTAPIPCSCTEPDPIILPPIATVRCIITSRSLCCTADGSPCPCSMVCIVRFFGRTGIEHYTVTGICR